MQPNKFYASLKYDFAINHFMEQYSFSTKGQSDSKTISFVNLPENAIKWALLLRE